MVTRSSRNAGSGVVVFRGCEILRSSETDATRTLLSCRSGGEEREGSRNFSAVFAHVMEKAVEHKGNVVTEQPARHFNDRRHRAATVEIRGVIVAGRALGELDADPEIRATLRCLHYAERVRSKLADGTSSFHACGRSWIAPCSVYASIDPRTRIAQT